MFGIFILIVGVGIYLGLQNEESSPNYSSEDIPVPNFLPPNSRVINEDGDYMIYDSSAFRIIYYEPEDKYGIAVYTTPFERHRTTAEQKFLNLMNITPSQACELDVTVRMVEFTDQGTVDKEYGLSFCE